MIQNFDRSKIEEQQFLLKKSESVKNNINNKGNNFYRNEYLNENKYVRRQVINNLQGKYQTNLESISARVNNYNPLRKEDAHHTH